MIVVLDVHLLFSPTHPADGTAHPAAVVEGSATAGEDFGFAPSPAPPAAGAANGMHLAPEMKGDVEPALGHREDHIYTSGSVEGSSPSGGATGTLDACVARHPAGGGR